MREVRKEAKSVQTAIELALNDLSLRRDQVEVHVESEGSSGFLGFGAKPAVVVVREKKWRSDRESQPQSGGRSRGRDRGGDSRGGDRGGRGGDRNRSSRGGRRSEGGRPPQGGGRSFGSKRKDPRDAYAAQPVSHEHSPEEYERVEMNPAAYAPSDNGAVSQNEPVMLAPLPDTPAPEAMKPVMEQATTALSEILAKMGVAPTNMASRWDGVQSRILISFDCENPQTVIGKDGKTIEAIQYLITLMISRKRPEPIAVQADTGNYWRRIEGRIVANINAAVANVQQSGRPFRMQPMPAAQRRFVHKVLMDNPDVQTYSEGEGKWRKIVVSPKPKTEATKAPEAATAAPAAEAVAAPAPAPEPAPETSGTPQA